MPGSSHQGAPGKTEGQAHTLQIESARKDRKRGSRAHDRGLVAFVFLFHSAIRKSLFNRSNDCLTSFRSQTLTTPLSRHGLPYASLTL